MNRLLAVISIKLFVIWLSAGIVFADEITVTDECSLADAISAANEDNAVGDCPVGNGADTIRLTEDIVLDGPLPKIGSNMTIEGDGFTIDGDNKYRVFYIVFDRTVTINNLTLTGGSTERGSAITTLPGGRLRITNSRFTDNHAPRDGGVIDSSGTILTIANSVFENNSAGLGGVIFSEWKPHLDADNGTLTIVDSIFKNNVAGYAGVLNNSRGVVNIRNSAFIGNRAEDDNAEGGAIRNFFGSLDIRNSSFTENSGQNGGAIYIFDTTLNITDSTLGGNEAGLGGALYVTYLHEVTFTHVTVANNRAEDGGGIYNDNIDDDDGAINLRNSVIAGNPGGDCVTGVHKNIFSWIGDGSCSAALQGDPMFGEMVVATDDTTAYLPPLENSPLIDSANLQYCTETDQLDVARPQGDACDIGAIEVMLPVDNA